MRRLSFVILILSVFCFAQTSIDYGYFSTYSDTLTDTTVVWATDSGCLLSSIYLYNMSADSTTFVFFYNSADTSLVGTTEPTLWYCVPKGENLTIQFYGAGVPFSDALQYVASNFYNKAGLPNAAVLINITYYDSWR